MRAIQLPRQAPRMRWPQPLDPGRPLQPFSATAARTAALLRMATYQHTPGPFQGSISVAYSSALPTDDLVLCSAAVRVGADVAAGAGEIAEPDQSKRCGPDGVVDDDWDTSDKTMHESRAVDVMEDAPVEADVKPIGDGSSDVLGCVRMGEGGLGGAAEGIARLEKLHSDKGTAVMRAHVLMETEVVGENASVFVNDVSRGEAIAVVLPKQLVLVTDSRASTVGSFCSGAEKLLDVPHAMLASVVQGSQRTLALTYFAPVAARYGVLLPHAGLKSSYAIDSTAEIGSRGLVNTGPSPTAANMVERNEEGQKGSGGADEMLVDRQQPPANLTGTSEGVPQGAGQATAAHLKGDKMVATSATLGGAPEGVLHSIPKDALFRRSSSFVEKPHGTGEVEPHDDIAKAKLAMEQRAFERRGLMQALQVVRLTFGSSAKMQEFAEVLRARQTLEGVVRRCRGCAAALWACHG
jgi:hypothetical protein